VATIDGGTVKVLAADGNYALSTRYTILTAGGGRTGEFDEVTSNLAFLTPSLGYDANNVYLTMDRNGIDFASVGGTPNQRSAGAGVESLGAGQPVWDAVVRLDAPGARIAFDQLSGEIHASAKTALIEDSRFVREAAVDRLRSGLNSDGHESVAWARFFGSWGRVSGDGNAAELDRSTGGFFAGADARLSGDWRGGVLAGYSRGNFDTDDRRSSGDSDNYHLGLYAGTQWGRLGLRVGAAYTWHDLSTSRVVGFQGFTEGLRGDYHANTTQVFGELGYGIDAGAAKLEPFANLAHVTLHTDGFTERGGAAALAGRSGNESTTFATLGLRVSSRGFELGGMKASATGSLGWRHAFGDVTPYSALRFAGAGNAFGIAGVPIAKDAAALDAGLEFSIGKNATLGLSYNGQFGSGLRDHGGRVDLRMKF
jgi:outer membrane autotransporter protein